MGLRVECEYRTFTLQIRCENCMREAVMGMAVPKEAGMPSDVEELQESAMLNNIPYQCLSCESIIGQVFSIQEGIAEQ